MKNNLASISIFVILTCMVSCSGVSSYYEQFTKDKAFTSRIADIDKTIEEVRTFEEVKIVKDDVSILKYVYEIGKNDTYIISYLFDGKGCYEIGIDAYFGKEEDASNVVDGIKSEMAASEYELVSEDNSLCRWKKADGSISIEIDYKDTSRGLFIATIFANE